jgi:hypothetical protein
VRLGYFHIKQIETKNKKAYLLINPKLNDKIEKELEQKKKKKTNVN